jgi:hypothetical protein
MKKTVCLLVTAVFLCAAGSSGARLGEKEKKAGSWEKQWAKKFGASAPFFKTNEQGIVIQECWEGPAEGWSEGKALKFGRHLVPPKLRKQMPKRGKVEGTYVWYKYKDGTAIVLSEGPTGFVQVEVHLSSFKGSRC